MNPDVIVVGGGVAGLAAATQLARDGWQVQLIEARDRLGGRICSLKPPGWPRAIELGAEFVHGGNAPFRAIAKHARMKFRSIETNMWRVKNGRLVLDPDFWETIGRVASRIPRRDHGWSFQQFLAQERKKISDEERQLVGNYVGSFNAAPIDEISAHALRAERAGADTTDLKPLGRYDEIIAGFRRQWPAGRVKVSLRSAATLVRWRKGGVVVETRATRGGVAKIEGRAAVIALPLGVLKARTVRFSPGLPEKQNLIRRAGWGHVVRVMVRFRRGFWSAPFLPRELAAREGREFGFVNAPHESVPVWWALQPPAPVLTGWAGGDVARRLERLSSRGIKSAAVRSLAHIFGTSSRAVAAAIDDWAMHDWRRDRYARGAYSFPVAGHENLAERLAEPVQDTLFFAGEALAADYGTVHGAIQSGVEAARTANAVLARDVLQNTPPVAPFPVAI